MNNTTNVKLNLESTQSITSNHSGIESYLYATDDTDRYSDYLSDKWAIEAELQVKSSGCFQA